MWVVGRLVGGVAAAAIVLFGCGGPVPPVTPASTATAAPHTATPPATESPSPSASPSPSPTPDPLAIAPGRPYADGRLEPAALWIQGADNAVAAMLLEAAARELVTVDGRPYETVPEAYVECSPQAGCRITIRGVATGAEFDDSWTFVSEEPERGVVQPMLAESTLFSVPRATLAALDRVVDGDDLAASLRATYRGLRYGVWDPRRPRVFVLVYLRPPGSGLLPDAGRPFASVGFEELQITVDAAQRRVLEVREIPFMGGA